MKPNTIQFVESFDLIPETWKGWFWSELADSSNITFGDVDYSILNASTFLSEVEDIIDNHDDSTDEEQNEFEALREKLLVLAKDNVYISL